MRYVVVPEFNNLFADIKDKLLEFNTGEETISYRSKGPSKVKKQLKMQGGDIRYYRANKTLEDKISNKFRLKPNSMHILVTPKNFKGRPHIDLGKRGVVLNILLQGTGKCYFNNSKEQKDIDCFTDSRAFFFEGSKYHFVNNLNNDIERIVLSINWFKKFTLNNIHEQSERTRLLF